MDMSIVPKYKNFTKPNYPVKLKNPDDFHAYWLPGSIHGFKSLVSPHGGTPNTAGVTFGVHTHGRCAIFDGTSATRIDCGLIDVSGLAQFTLTAIVFYDDTGTDEHTIFSNWNNTVNNGMILMRIDPATSNRVEFHVCRDADTEISAGMSDLSLTANKVHIITCRFNSIDGTGLTGFLDDIKSTTSTATSSTLDTSATLSNTYLGNSPHANTTDGLTGGIYAVMFRKKALTDEEVFALHRDWYKDLEPAYPRNRVGISTGLTITTTSITSAEAFGTASLNMNILPSFVGSSEAFGVLSAIMNINASSIASSESHGTPQLILNITAQSISSAESFGAPQLNQFINAISVASSEAFGTATLSFPGVLTINCEAISSSEAFGSASVNQSIATSGVSSSESFGVPILSQIISVSAIPSNEAFGQTQLNMFVNAIAIDSSESFGSHAVNMAVMAISITSEEAFGNPVLNQLISAVGITSAESFGTLVITGGATALGYLEATITAYPSIDGSAITFVALDGVVKATSTIQ